MIPLFRFLIGTALISVSLAAGGFVEPYPVNSCSGGIAFGAVTCPNQPGCCSGGAVCCAGGCCPITAWCVNYGLPNEGCCPFSDKSNCGAVVPSYTLPACGGPPKPSKVCVTADDSWYCPPGDTCGTTRGSCYSIFNTCVPGKVDPPSPTTPPGTPGGSNSGSSNGGGSSSGSQSNEGVGQPRILWSEGIMALGAAVFVVIL